MQTTSKKAVTTLALLSFVVSMTMGMLVEVPFLIVLGRAGLVSAVFGGVTALVVLLTERA